MYFPFLYAKKHELLALRNLLGGTRSLSKLVPILEPVNTNGSEIIRCVDAYGEAKSPLAVLINATKHQLKKPENRAILMKGLDPLFKKHPTLIPTFRCHSDNNHSEVEAFLKAYQNRDLAIIYDKHSLSETSIRALGKNQKIKYHILTHEKIGGGLDSLLPQAKLVKVHDNFKKLQRNSDYGAPEKFSDQHKTFTSSGIGFGDYTTIGATLPSGGSTPHAVAIHATYKDSGTGDVWIEHFVSDDQEPGVGDVAQKYVQAAKKLARAAKKRPHEFGSNAALAAYARQASSSSYHGLGRNKEQQIEHHVSLMLDILDGRL